MPQNGAITAEDLFRAVVGHHADVPDLEPRRGFGSGALTVNGKIFASLSKGRLLLKLPERVVDRLISSNRGERFSTGANRTKKEWVTVGVSDAATWIALSQQARAYAQDLQR
jgi:TfoX/Sxy family transcriptional regulator of competence genes